ncbi:MAG: hypothetical protein K2K46_01455 [Lachnospiraceae bacterium]|nr:hypothetical protein [Lachnospiraceae bacterium]
MDDKELNQIAHDLAFGKFLHRLFLDYKDVNLSDGQLYTLYQECYNFADLEEMINNGSAERLP